MTPYQDDREEERRAQRIEDARRRIQERLRDSKEQSLRINPQGEGNVKLAEQELALTQDD